MREALSSSPAGRRGSARVDESPRPRGAGVLVRVLEVGVCGTDREISEGLFGVAPDGEERLVLGHELLGGSRRTGTASRAATS